MYGKGPFFHMSFLLMVYGAVIALAKIIIILIFPVSHLVRIQY